MYPAATEANLMDSETSQVDARGRKIIPSKSDKLGPAAGTLEVTVLVRVSARVV
jgi:hypothetical protein